MSITKHDEPLPEDAVGTPPRKRGFAALSPERLRVVSSAGGKAAHAKGVGHEFTSEEAREAGRKGGIATGRKGRDHMAKVGAMGNVSQYGEKGGTHAAWTSYARRIWDRIRASEHWHGGATCESIGCPNGKMLAPVGGRSQ